MTPGPIVESLPLYAGGLWVTLQLLVISLAAGGQEGLEGQVVSRVDLALTLAIVALQHLLERRWLAHLRPRA